MEAFLPLILKVVGALLGLGMTALSGYVIKKLHLSGVKEDLARTISAGVNDTYANFVGGLKKEGKFDGEARKAAMKRTLSYVVQKGSKPAVRLAVKYGEDFVKSMVERLIQKGKIKG